MKGIYYPTSRLVKSLGKFVNAVCHICSWLVCWCRIEYFCKQFKENYVWENQTLLWTKASPIYTLKLTLWLSFHPCWCNARLERKTNKHRLINKSFGKRTVIQSLLETNFMMTHTMIKNEKASCTLNINWESWMMYINSLRTWRSLGGYSTWLVAFTIATSNSFKNKNATQSSKHKMEETHLEE